MRKVIGEQNRWEIDEIVIIHIIDDNGERLMLYSTSQLYSAMTFEWSHIMSIIDNIGFSNKWIVEIYPPKDKILDNDDVRHFWIIDEPNYGFK